MTVACNPRTGECHSIKNFITPKDFPRKLKSKSEEEVTKKNIGNSYSNHEIVINNDDNSVKLSGEYPLEVDSHYLRGSE